MWQAGVLAGWSKGFSGAIPQDMRINKGFEVPLPLLIFLFQSSFSVSFRQPTLAPAHPQDVINAMRRAAQYTHPTPNILTVLSYHFDVFNRFAHACGAHSDAAVISTCVKSMGV
jgi:hypothetical protein